MSSLSKKYLSIISKILDKISDEEEKKITDCARIIADSYKKGGQLYIFGTGKKNGPLHIETGKTLITLENEMTELKEASKNLKAIIPKVHIT